MQKRGILMKNLARMSSLMSRYGALLAQFIIVILIARYLTKDDAGVYLLVFGAVTSTSVFAGLGAPDGLVKAVPELLTAGHNGSARMAIRRSALFTVVTSAGLLAALALFGLITGVAMTTILFFLAWWAGYAAVFFCGQALVALGKSQLGAFAFYALNNLLLMMTTVPYLLFTSAPDVMGALSMSLCASALAVCISAGFLFFAMRGLPRKADPSVKVPETFRLGLVIATARMFQAVLYWIPAWAIASVSGPADAAVVGTAGRLLIAATAVIAVFRFTIRSRIVSAAAQHDYAAMERMSRVAATIATGAAVVALIMVLAVGEPLIALLFGEGFRGAAPVLAILLVGAIGESVGGPVDEVLKYNGQAMPVLIGLIVTVALEAVLALNLAHYGPLWVAAAQAMAFCCMYLFQILWCRTKVGIWILPYFSFKKLKNAMSA